MRVFVFSQAMKWMRREQSRLGLEVLLIAIVLVLALLIVLRFRG